MSSSAATMVRTAVPKRRRRSWLISSDILGLLNWIQSDVVGPGVEVRARVVHGSHVAICAAIVQRATGSSREVLASGRLDDGISQYNAAAFVEVPSARLERRDRADDLIRRHDCSGVVGEIDVESGVHLYIRVIRRRVFYHRDVVP